MAGAAIGTGVAMIPDIAAAYAGMKGLYKSNNPKIAGSLNTTKELSPQYAAQNEVIGITGKVPETASRVAYENPQQYPSMLSNVRYDKAGNPISTGARMTVPKPVVQAEQLPSSIPIKYPNDPGTLINQANARMNQFGTKLTPQELADYKALLDTNISNGNIPKFDPNGKPTQIFAQASATKAKVNDLLNQVADIKLKTAQVPSGTMPTREGLNKAYGIAANREALGRTISKYLKYAAKGGGVIGGGSYGLKAISDFLSK
jgi:hypothetical protein